MGRTIIKSLSAKRYPKISFVNSFWTHQYLAIFDECKQLPKDRHLIVRTNEIGKKNDTPAKLVGIPADTLLREQTHLNKAKYNVNILKQLDFDFLHDKFEQHCSALMRKFFPEYTLRCN